jgi:hypothetical protein
VLALIANDGVLDAQSKSAAYYQSSVVSLGPELDFRNSQVYLFGAFISRVKIAFLIPLHYLDFKQVCGFRIRLVLKLRLLLHQIISSFTKQAVFVNEIFNSKNTYRSLYRA